MVILLAVPLAAIYTVSNDSYVFAGADLTQLLDSYQRYGRGYVLVETQTDPAGNELLKRYREVSAKAGPDLQPVYDEFPQGVNMLRLRDAVWRSLSGSDVLRLNPVKGSLEDLYMKLVGKGEAS